MRLLKRLIGAGEQHPLSDLEPAADRDTHAQLLKRATYASVTVATLLIAIKLVAWLRTDSVAILSALVDSMLDLVASLVTLFAVRHALSPADREHRFGHGKAEALAGLGQATFIAGSSTLLLIEAVRRLIRPTQIINADFALIVIAVSIVLTLLLVMLQRRVVSRTGSVAIAGDSMHYTGDLLTNFGIIISLFLTSRLGWVYLDPLFGGAVGLFLLYNAWKIGQRALAMLMDRELPDEARAKILEIARAHQEVADVHELRTRESGPDQFIQFHLEMNGDMPLREAHAIADAVEAELMEAFPNAEIIIHQDPEDLEEDHRPIE